MTKTLRVERTNEEVYDLLNAVADQQEEGGSRYPGMSYEQGIEAAIRWLTEKEADHPYDEE